MSDSMKVEITNSGSFGAWAFFGAFAVIGWLIIIFDGADYVIDKFSSHKQKYIISVESKSWTANDYARKLSGQIVFEDCATGNQITINTDNPVVTISTLDPQTAEPCKAPK